MRSLIRALTVLSLAGIGVAQEREPKDASFDKDADAKKGIAAAVARARHDNKRVLLVYGGNWCEWCHKMLATFKDPKVSRTLDYEYEPVFVDIDKVFSKNQDIAKQHESDIRSHGVPYLTVLSSDGKAVAHTGTKPLRTGSEIDPSKVWTFLEKHGAEPVDAADVLAAARARAREQGKLLFIHLGAPWCVWCRRLQEFLEREGIAGIMAKDFVPVKVDQDRMKHGRLMAEVLRQGRGSDIPWFVIAGPDMKQLVTSDGPQGNIGCPVKPEEIAHFVAMLNKVRKQMTDTDVARIQKALEEDADKILSRLGR